jgi:ElaA protein
VAAIDQLVIASKIRRVTAASHNPMDVAWSWLGFSELTPRQLYDLLALRQQVFVVEQACVYVDADGMDQRCWHGLGQRSDGALVAYARLLPPGLKYSEPSIGRVVTAPAARGCGLGVELMRRTLAEAARRFPGQALRIQAQCYLERFYRGFGFIPIGQPYDEDGIPHVDMIKAA